MPPQPFTRIAAVTGANKGIGLAVVRNLALQYPSSPLYNGGPLLIYLCARDRSRGGVGRGGRRAREGHDEGDEGEGGGVGVKRRADDGAVSRAGCRGGGERVGVQGVFGEGAFPGGGCGG